MGCRAYERRSGGWTLSWACAEILDMNDATSLVYGPGCRNDRLVRGIVCCPGGQFKIATGTSRQLATAACGLIYLSPWPDRRFSVGPQRPAVAVILVRPSQARFDTAWIGRIARIPERPKPRQPRTAGLAVPPWGHAATASRMDGSSQARCACDSWLGQTPPNPGSLAARRSNCRWAGAGS